MKKKKLHNFLNISLLILAITITMSALFISSKEYSALKEYVEAYYNQQIIATSKEQADILQDEFQQCFDDAALLADILSSNYSYQINHKDFQQLVDSVFEKNHFNSMIYMNQDMKIEGTYGSSYHTYVENDAKYMSKCKAILNGQNESDIYLKRIYLSDDETKTRKYIYLLLPVKEENKIQGILSLSMNVYSLHEKILWNGENGDGTLILITNSSGDIFLKNAPTDEYSFGKNFFSSLIQNNQIDTISQKDVISSIGEPTSVTIQKKNLDENKNVNEQKDNPEITHMHFIIQKLEYEDLYLMVLKSDISSFGNISSFFGDIGNGLLFLDLIALVILITSCFLLFKSLSQMELQLFERDDKVKKSQEKITGLEEQLADAKTRIMIGQMQPHFLYNALASIREVILIDPEYASNLVYDFTIFLRSCIRSMTHSEFIPFSKELENITAYTNIEKMRFGDQLQIEYQIEDDTFSIIPLSIQPLVENAIRHGIFPKTDGNGLIQIRSYRENNMIMIEVEDNGVGFNPSLVMEEARQGIRDSNGLINIIFRFEKIMQAKVEIQSQPGQGTLVKVMIPISK